MSQRRTPVPCKPGVVVKFCVFLAVCLRMYVQLAWYSILYAYIIFNTGIVTTLGMTALRALGIVCMLKIEKTRAACSNLDTMYTHDYMIL
jgi:hypothetical protein